MLKTADTSATAGRQETAGLLGLQNIRNSRIDNSSKHNRKMMDSDSIAGTPATAGAPLP